MWRRVFSRYICEYGRLSCILFPFLWNVPICFVVTEAARWRILAGKSHLQFGAGERLGNAGGHTPALLILSTAADEAPVNYHKTQGEIR